jgi:hypothetical protein
MTRASQLALAASVALGAFLINDNMSLTQPSSLVSRAEARIGQPLSPVSVAGVARRQTRRAVYGGGVYGGAYGGGYGGGVYGGAYGGGYGGVYHGALYGAYASAYVDAPGALAVARRAAWGDYGYGGWNDYATRNSIVCEPGTNIRFGDGLLYLCQ